jgi:hypothetical protein
MTGPLGGSAGDPRAPTINAKNVDGGPLGGGAIDPGAPTINTKHVDGGPPWEVVLEIWKLPPST